MKRSELDVPCRVQSQRYWSGPHVDQLSSPAGSLACMFDLDVTKGLSAHRNLVAQNSSPSPFARAVASAWNE